MTTNLIRIVLVLSFVTFAFQPYQQSAAQSAGTREVPARALPVPDTVSSQMQAMIARPFDPKFNLVPETEEQSGQRGGGHRGRAAETS
jgi:hypothetical protein